MQRVVNQYQKDPNVKFLFIHTLESNTDPLNDAKKYSCSNHYTFDLYIDKKNAQTHKNEAVIALGITAIPIKLIIDDKGNIRFKVTRFSSSDDDAVAEVSTMINIAKKS